jgi:hypothetical protein
LAKATRVMMRSTTATDTATPRAARQRRRPHHLFRLSTARSDGWRVGFWPDQLRALGLPVSISPFADDLRHVTMGLQAVRP